MSLGGDIRFVEPELTSKRVGVVNKRFGKEALTSEAIQERLLEIRKLAVKNSEKNLKLFLKNIKMNEHITLHKTNSPAEVVSYIINQATKLGISRVDINRSNTIRPMEKFFNEKGFEVVHTYNHAIKSGNLAVFTNTKLGNYWTFGNIDLANNFQSFNTKEKPLAYTRKLITKSTSANDFVGLLGANVFTPMNEFIFVQHLYNISSILTHAKQTFIVLTIDKLVNDYQHALFQARCTAMYGLEQIILDLFDIERLRGKLEDKGKIKKTKETKTSKEDYFQKFKPPENLHVILLDDGRSILKGTKQEDLLYCISCRKCGILCPRVRVGRQKPELVTDFEQINFTLTARELLIDGYLYGPETAIDHGLFDCTLCRSCTTVCPLGIELVDHLLDLREKCQHEDLFSEPHRRIRNNILGEGNAYGSKYSYNTKTKAQSGGNR